MTQILGMDLGTNSIGWAIIDEGKQEIVDVARKSGMPEIMEGRFNSLSNGVFHRISEEITREIGLPTSDRVFPEWKSWLKKRVRKR